jgi:hypothetical protein
MLHPVLAVFVREKSLNQAAMVPDLFERDFISIIRTVSLSRSAMGQDIRKHNPVRDTIPESDEDQFGFQEPSNDLYQDIDGDGGVEPSVMLDADAPYQLIQAPQPQYEAPPHVQLTTTQPQL